MINTDLKNGLFYVTLMLLAFILTGFMRQFALKKAILDIPNQRSSHQAPTPRGGGLAFVALFYLGLIVLWQCAVIPVQSVLALAGGVLVAVVGYIDDVFSLAAKWRFIAHLASAVWGICFLSNVSSFYLGPTVWHLPGLMPVLAVLFIVWCINLYNFMDGIDGLATLQGIFVVGLSALLLHNQSHAFFHVCLLLMVVLLGFLPWNWSPAKIFMGDVASGFLGYILAMFCLITNSQQSLPLPVWWIMLSIFLCDASFTLLHRICQGRVWHEAHREHAYQRLTQIGFSHRKVSLGAFLLNCAFVLPMTYYYLTIKQAWLAVSFMVLFFVAMWGLWYGIMLYYTKHNAD